MRHPLPRQPIPLALVARRARTHDVVRSVGAATRERNEVVHVVFTLPFEHERVRAVEAQMRLPFQLHGHVARGEVPAVDRDARTTAGRLRYEDFRVLPGVLALLRSVSVGVAVVARTSARAVTLGVRGPFTRDVLAHVLTTARLALTAQPVLVAVLHPVELAERLDLLTYQAWLSSHGGTPSGSVRA